jgi:hypothetical protein
MMSAKSLSMMFCCALCTCASAQSPAQESFGALTRLAGQWRGTGTGGHRVQITFRVMSAGSAVFSELVELDRNEEMVTVFHLDGDRLLLTHYCTAGNQPRMHATASPDDKTIVFDFVDATNLRPHQKGHMRRLVIRLHDPDHHTEEWTFVENGKEVKDLLDMHRVKS